MEIFFTNLSIPYCCLGQWNRAMHSIGTQVCILMIHSFFLRMESRTFVLTIEEKEVTSEHHVLQCTNLLLVKSAKSSCAWLSFSCSFPPSFSVLSTRKVLLGCHGDQIILTLFYAPSSGTAMEMLWKYHGRVGLAPVFHSAILSWCWQ